MALVVLCLLLGLALGGFFIVDDYAGRSSAMGCQCAALVLLCHPPTLSLCVGSVAPHFLSHDGCVICLVLVLAIPLWAGTAPFPIDKAMGYTSWVNHL